MVVGNLKVLGQEKEMTPKLIRLVASAYRIKLKATIDGQILEVVEHKQNLNNHETRHVAYE